MPRRRGEDDPLLATGPLIAYLDRFQRVRRHRMCLGSSMSGELGLDELLGDTAARWVRKAREEETILLSKADVILTRLDADRGLRDLYPDA